MKVRRTVRNWRVSGVAALMLVAGYSLTADAADKGLTATIEKPAAEVQKAAVAALTVIGCEIKQEEPLVVQGVRKRHFGVVVGSGGETVTATLTEVAPGKTDVTITTKKSFMGMAGQKNWNQPTLDEINKALAGTASAPAGDPAAPADAPAAAEEPATPEPAAAL